MRGLQGLQTGSNFWNSKYYSVQRNIKKKRNIRDLAIDFVNENKDEIFY
jgi:hypothetical protein